MPADQPKAYLVDDDPSVLKALTRLLRSEGIPAEAFPSAQAFLSEIGHHHVGCIVVDLAMPGLDGLQLQAALRNQECPLPIIFLTGHADVPKSVHAMKHGALDFLTKPVNDADFLRAVRAGLAMSKQQLEASAARSELQTRMDSLTPREHEVFRQVVAGRLNKQIASDLGTVEQTIKVHRARVMEKMKVQSVAELARIAERLGVGRDDLRSRNLSRKD